MQLRDKSLCCVAAREIQACFVDENLLRVLFAGQGEWTEFEHHSLYPKRLTEDFDRLRSFLAQRDSWPPAPVSPLRQAG